MQNLVRNSQIRAWFFPDGVSPDQLPVYKGRYTISDISKAFGDLTLVEEPSPDTYDSFEIVDVVQGAPSLVSVDLTGRMRLDDDFMQSLAGCRLDIQAHMGNCENPQDYIGGWQRIVVLEGAYLTNYNMQNLSAMETGERSTVNEVATFGVSNVYPVRRLNLALVGTGLLPIGFIRVYTAKHCITCERATRVRSCDTVIALSDTAGAIHYTTDAWKTESATGITGAVGAGTALGLAGRYVYAGTADNKVNVADLSRIVAGTAVWTNITTPSIPRAITPDRFGNVWVGMSSGNVIKITGTKIVDTYSNLGGTDVRQIAISQDVSDIFTVLAVGDNSNIWYTLNDGKNWVKVTAPVVASYRAAWVIDTDRWLVGTQTGGFYYTDNRGSSWQTLSLPSDIIEIKSISFSTRSVGYMLARTSANEAAIFRTTSGGGNWQRLPETGGSLPNTVPYKSLGTCYGNPNLFYVGGTSTGGASGVIIKGSP